MSNLNETSFLLKKARDEFDKQFQNLIEKYGTAKLGEWNINIMPLLRQEKKLIDAQNKMTETCERIRKKAERKQRAEHKLRDERIEKEKNKELKNSTVDLDLIE